MLMFFTDSLTVWIYIKINSKAAQEGLYFQVLCNCAFKFFIYLPRGFVLG